MSHTSQVCMSDLQSFMTSSFILSAIQKLGHYPITANITKKRKGDDKEICILQFPNEDSAKQAVFKLNGLAVPNSGYVGVRAKFKLSQCIGRSTDYTVWVGDFTTDVDDYQLFKFFSSYFKSLCNAKVIYDQHGVSKCYGFLRFSNEDDQKNCLKKMNGVMGLGGRPIKVAPNTKTANHGSSIVNNSAERCDIFEDSWKIYTSWNQFNEPSDYVFVSIKEKLSAKLNSKSGTDMKLVEYNTPLNIEDLNSEIFERDCYLWDATECSKWIPEGLLSTNSSTKV